jgi:hypothetical protein
MKSLLIILLCTFMVGCQSESYETRTYDVSVKNESAGPVTVWLTKDGAPYEPGWLAPEDLAIESPHGPTHVISGLVVPQGKEGFTGPRVGRFEPQTGAILRVYAGQLKYEQILATEPDGKRRIDQELHPGMNHLVVTGDSTAIAVHELESSQ